MVGASLFARRGKRNSVGDMMNPIEKITLRPKLESDADGPTSGTTPMRRALARSSAPPAPYATRQVSSVSALSAWKAGPSARPSVRKPPPPPPRLAPPPTTSTPSELLPPSVANGGTSVPPPLSLSAPPSTLQPRSVEEEGEFLPDDAAIHEEAPDDILAASAPPPSVAAAASPFDVQIIDSSPDDPLESLSVVSDVPTISRSRFIAMRVIVGFVLTGCGAILVLAGWRALEHRSGDATAELSTTPSMPTSLPAADVPTAAAPAAETAAAPQAAAPTARPAQTVAPRRRTPTRHKAVRPAKAPL